jgi:hypothetical protein
MIRDVIPGSRIRIFSSRFPGPDPGSGSRVRIPGPDPGSGGQNSTGSRPATLHNMTQASVGRTVQSTRKHALPGPSVKGEIVQS